MIRIGLLGAAALFACAAVAQDSAAPSIQRIVELPAHRTLQSVIADPTTNLATFETDGCSGGMSATWRVIAEAFPGFEVTHRANPPWEDCCVAHDRRYHNIDGAQSAEASFDARLSADEELRACVIAFAANRTAELAETYDATEEDVRRVYEAIGETMYRAVRLGGGPCSGLPWRWGYGYPGCFFRADD